MDITVSDDSTGIEATFPSVAFTASEPGYSLSASSDGVTLQAAHGGNAMYISEAIIDAVSPRVDVTAIPGGHRVTVTDIEGEKTFDVMDGGAGTMDYELLDNKPSIESVTLMGDKTFEELRMNKMTNAEIEAMLT